MGQYSKSALGFVEFNLRPLTALGSRMIAGLEGWKSLENGLTWVVSSTGSALIPAGRRSGNSKGLALSGVEVEPVSSGT